MESFAEIRKIAWRTIAEFLGFTEPTDVLGGAAVAKYLRGDGTWKEDIDVFLIGGQSNAVGYGSSASAPSVPTGKVLQINSGTITDANDPVGNANTGSAWPAFGLTYYYATGRKICFVPKAIASSAQAAANDTGSGNWDASGTLYSASVTALNTALTDLAAANYNPVFRGVLWGQAETDALPASNKTIYQAALEAMLVRYRSTYGATMPFYIFQVGTDNPVTAGFATIRAAQLAIAASDLYTKIIFRNAQDFITRGLMADQYHYTQAGYNEMGRVGASNVVSGFAAVDWQRNALTTDDIYYTGNARVSGTLTLGTDVVGTWTTPTFDAGDFTASGSGTWTVASGDVTTYAYTIIGKMMVVMWSLDTTTVGGTPGYYLYLKIPAGKVATKACAAVHGYSQAGTPGFGSAYVNNALFGANIALGIVAGGAWSTGTNNAVTVGQIVFEIN